MNSHSFLPTLHYSEVNILLHKKGISRRIIELNVKKYEKDESNPEITGIISYIYLHKKTG